jgi:CelD/BcsL family acetyltransferase involved in cellulose biosynthesis
VSAGAGLDAGFEDIDSTRWSESLSGLRHDVYHLPSYVDFAARRQEVGIPLAFVATEGDRRFFVPLIVRRIPPALTNEAGPLFDATCPRGYPGPLVQAGHGREGDEFIDRAITAFRERMNERSIVTAFVRLHPLLLPPISRLQQAGDVVKQGESISIDLTLSSDEMWRQTRANHRRDISKAMRQGYLARIDDEWRRFDEFGDIYGESMVRLDAHESWRLSREYLADLRGSLPGLIHLCVVELGGELAAAAVLTEVDGIVEYNLAATADSHVGASPSKLAVDFVRRWAKDRGNRVFHLAGSVRTGDALSHFKAGFSPLRHPVDSWRIVANAEIYAELVRNSREHQGREDLGSGEYFPAYRRPGTKGDASQSILPT